MSEPKPYLFNRVINVVPTQVPGIVLVNVSIDFTPRVGLANTKPLTTVACVPMRTEDAPSEGDAVTIKMFKR